MTDKLVQFSNNLISSLSENPEAVEFYIYQAIEKVKLNSKMGIIIGLSGFLLSLISGIIFLIFRKKTIKENIDKGTLYENLAIVSAFISFMSVVAFTIFTHEYLTIVKAPLSYMLPKILKIGL